MHWFNTRKAAVLLAAAVLAACGGGSDKSIRSTDGSQTPGVSPGDEATNPNGISQKLLPAASETVFLNLETGELVGENGDWHIAASRLDFKLNGGASGSGRVGGSLAVAQEDFYSAEDTPDVNMFTNATANSEEEHLLGMFEQPDEWIQDAFSSAFGSAYSWSQYDPGTGVIREKADVGYLVRSAEGESFARMRVVDFHFPTRAGNGIERFRFEFDVQAADANGFSDTPVIFETPANYDGGDACFDFDAPAVVDCTTSQVWDVQVGFSGRGWYLKSNSGVSGSGRGGASAPMTWDALAANDADPGVPQLYGVDATGGVLAEHTWYAYNLLGQHKIWPNYRTFLIKSDIDDPGAAVWALQIVNYYDENGVSGQPTVRWLPVELEPDQE